MMNRGIRHPPKSRTIAEPRPGCRSCPADAGSNPGLALRQHRIPNGDLVPTKNRFGPPARGTRAVPACRSLELHEVTPSWKTFVSVAR